MSALIEFLLQNLFFVVIIVSGIYSFFKRAMSNENEKPIPQTRQKPKPRQFTVPEVTVEDEQTGKRETLSETLNKQKENPFMEAYQNNNLGGSVDNSLNDITVLAKKKKRNNKRNTSDELVFSKNEVVKGIIWSKILEEPRSKKPYRSRIRRG
jgi:hypothetical protein